MKVEDYFQNYKIENEEKKCNKFRDTCCGKAHTWLSTLTDYPKIFYPDKTPDDETKLKTMKNLFWANWELKGRTPPQSLSIEWQNLQTRISRGCTSDGHKRKHSSCAGDTGDKCDILGDQRHFDYTSEEPSDKEGSND